MNQPVALRRCLAVAGVATGLLAALAAFLLPDVVAGLASLRPDAPRSASFDVLLVRGCAGAALLAAWWLWAVTCVVALRAAHGRSGAARCGVPEGLRLLVLAACGVALAGAVSGPAGAAPGAPHADGHGPSGIAGLPLPDRATGGAREASAAAVRLSRDGHAVPVDDVVVVRPGDTLWGLAVRHLPPGAAPTEVTACWHRIHELNRAVIGDDPDLIQPDQRLRLPRR